MIAASDAEEAARRAWRAALDRYSDHTQQCDSYVADVPCGGCGHLLKREQESYAAYYRAKGGR